MATEGSFNTNAYNKRRSVQFSWYRTDYSVKDNYSEIHWELKGGTVSSGSPSWYILHPCYLGITYKEFPDKKEAYHEIYSNDNVNIQLSYDKLITSGDIRIYHEPDGKAKFSVAVSAGIYFNSINVEGNKDFNIDEIPRATFCPNISGTIGTSIMVYLSASTPSFSHSLSYVFGNLSGTIPTDNTSWIIPVDFYSEIPNAKQGEGLLTLITYNKDGTEVGRKNGKLYAYCEEADCIPSGTGTIVDTNPKTIELTGDSKKIIKGYSNAFISYNARSKNGAIIKKILINGLIVPINDTDKSCDLSILNAQSSHYIMRIEDSRNFVREVSIGDIDNLIEYSPLNAVLNVKRDKPTGDKAFLFLSGKIFNENFGLESNALKIKWRVKSEEGFSDFQDIKQDVETNSFDISVEIKNPLSEDSSWNYLKQYLFEVILSDKVSESKLNFTLKKGKPNHYWYEKDGVNFFNINGRLLIDQKDIWDIQYPVNSIVMFYDDSDHSDYLGFKWARVLKDRIPRGYIGNGSEHLIGERGGSAALQKHTHSFKATTEQVELKGNLGEVFSGSIDTNSGIVTGSTVGSYRQYTTYSQATNMWKTFNLDASHNHKLNGTTDETGEGADNWNPYEIVSFWRRIS